MTELQQALDTIGGLSDTSKMPCYSYSLPAGAACPTGSKLLHVPGSICERCYAMRGYYTMWQVRDAMERRLEIVQKLSIDPGIRNQWILCFAYVLNYRLDHVSEDSARDPRYFRWHDSGEVQGIRHLEAIDTVAELTPRIRHWLPTKEVQLVGYYIRTRNRFAQNLTVRVGATMFGQRAPTEFTGYASSAHRAQPGLFDRKSTGQPGDTMECPAHLNGFQCGECRACWTAPAVSYPEH